MVNLQDPIFRTAIWEVYNRKCYYCKELIQEFTSFHIDHIIYKAIIQNKPNKFEELKKKLNLSPNFDINDIINLVPSHIKCNRDKRDKVLEIETYLHHFSITKDKVILIKKKMIEIGKKFEKFKKEALNEYFLLQEQSSEILIPNLKVIEEIMEIWSEIPPSENDVLGFIVLEKFNEIFHKKSISDEEFPIIKKFIEFTPKIIFNTDGNLNLDIIHILYLLTPAKKAKQLLNKKIIPDIIEIYNSGNRDKEIIKFLFYCGVLKDLFSLMIKASDEKNLDFVRFLKDEYYNLISKKDEKHKIIQNRKEIIKNLTKKKHELGIIENPSSEVKEIIERLNEIIRNIMKLE